MGGIGKFTVWVNTKLSMKVSSNGLQTATFVPLVGTVGIQIAKYKPLLQVLLAVGFSGESGATKCEMTAYLRTD